jgi:hypothetical protein
MTKNKKTEHAGAKNGGGHWGPREEAKALSKKARRINSKKDIKQELANLKDSPKESIKRRGRP